MKTKGKFLDTLKVYDNGTATVKGRLLYEEDVPVITDRGKAMTIDKDFLELVASRFNKRTKKMFGLQRRYPPIVMEHIYEPNVVVGRFDSPITVEEEEVHGEKRYAMFADLLLTDEDLVKDLQDRDAVDEVRGLSVGIVFDDEDMPEFEELTITSDPVKEDAMLLSNNTQGKELKIDKNSEIAKDLKQLEDMVQDYHNKTEKYHKLKLAKDREDEKKKQEKLRLKKEKEKENWLLKQVYYNKMSRREALQLSKQCNYKELDTMKKVFSYVTPDRFHTTTTFVNKPQKVKEKDNGQ